VKYLCLVCKKEFSSRKSIREHIKKEHKHKWRFDLNISKGTPERIKKPRQSRAHLSDYYKKIGDDINKPERSS